MLKINHFPPPYFLQTAYTDKFYLHGHAQLRYDGTAAILPHELHCKFHQGIFIDIFVHDTLPKDGNTLVHSMLKAETLRKLMEWRSLFRFSLSNWRASLRWLASVAYFTFHDFRKTYRKFENCYAHYDGEPSDMVSCPCFFAASVLKFRHRRELFNETIMMPFEDMMVPVPAGYDEILRNYYGDYMTPVKAPSMHGSVIFDTERSYKEVIKELRKGQR